MLFRNLTLFRFPESSAAKFATLESDLPDHELRAIGPLEYARRGIVSPYGRGRDELVVRCGAAFAMVCVGTEERMLPSSVITEELAERIAKVAETQGRRVGAKERKRLKEEVISELLPRAFVRTTRQYAYANVGDGWFVVDTASRKRAEECVSQVREALGRFPAHPLAPEESPRALMTGWLIDGKLPEGFTFGDSCVLFDPAVGGSSWRGRNVDLQSDEVREHLNAGMQVERLALIYLDRLSFVLGEDLSIRQLRFLDEALTPLDNVEDADAVFAADFTIMAGELTSLLGTLAKVFGIERPGERT